MLHLMLVVLFLEAVLVSTLQWDCCKGSMCDVPMSLSWRTSSCLP